MSVKKISILGTESIIIGCGLLKDCGKIAHDACKAAKYAVITDENVAPLYLEKVLTSFEEATGTRPSSKVLSPGEQMKCRIVKAEVEDWLISERCGRDATLIALGGGVIGDLTGYIAATFMRGIKVVQIPTTLLAMVDSSVGGKTGIDVPSGKNLIGAFHHPTRIIMDLETLISLPQRQLCNGMAEVIKTALLWDYDRFSELEDRVDEVLGKDPKWLQSIVEGSAGIKAEVVTKDEKEGGLRTLLNVGHSVGHAVEAFLQPEMLHGEAVSIGIVKEAQISRRLGYISEAEVGRIVRCLQAYKLPVAVPPQLSLDGLMQKMAVDKKNKAGDKYISLLERIGKCVQNRAIKVGDEVIKQVLASAVEILPLENTKKSIELSVPGSKSLSNRALLVAALGKGKCKVKGLLHSDDTQVMLDALQSLKSCSVEWTDNGDSLLITGNGGQLTAAGDNEIYLGNAGTASRFLTTAVALAKGNHSILTGNRRMKQRPIAPLVDALTTNGVVIDYQRTKGCLPIKVHSSENGFPGGDISLSADISSQYVSSVLISSPYAHKEMNLTLTGDSIVSQPYIDMTISIMKDFGVVVKREPNTDIYHVPKGEYINPAEYQVEADASSATYPLAIPAIVSSLSDDDNELSVTVNGIGTSSVQGDAHFAELLEKMGCVIKQTENATTVSGPPKGTRLRAIDINMNDMTDAFMTAAVVMALADGTSRITGIANQRVKECNRILAMVTEFKKIGVVCRELPDGIEVDGTTIDKLTPGKIHCYNDHRIAMSFAILGLKVPGITITDTACVEKTYPIFWDHLSNIIGASVIPKEPVTDLQTRVADNESLVLIGMRGAGKTTLGKEAASLLGWNFIDMDDYFEKHHSSNIADTISNDGWATFRKIEADFLTKVLKEHPENTIIATGGGIIETEQGRASLSKSKRVIFINKPFSLIKTALADCSKPGYGEELEGVFNRRHPLYRENSNYELWADGDFDTISNDMTRLVEHVTQRSRIVPSDLKSFLSLTFDDVSKILPSLKEVEGGADALELRVDLLKSTSIDFVSEQLVLLRRHSTLPVIFTVRTESQGGRFPDNNQVAQAELLKQSIRLGCEFIDVEMSLHSDTKEDILEVIKPSFCVMSHHDPKRTLSWDALKMKIIEGSSVGHGAADIVKIVTTAFEVDDCSRLRAAVKEANIQQPVIALAMGSLGKLSRALNEVMTPITHSKMPVVAAPGQLSMASINQLRMLIGYLPDRRSFHLFGKPISQSKSPLIHNTGFENLGLAPGYLYTRVETDGIDKVKEAVSKPEFHGASVTIPLKEMVSELCTTVTDAAKQIGAINTLTRLPCGGLEGDNTDWLAMRDLTKKSLNGRKGKVGLCIGAGGSARAACYTMKQLGVDKVVVWNRTHSKAVDLANEFGCEAAEDISALQPDVIISNIPGDTQEESLPEFVIKPTSVIIEMAYLPRVTLLLQKGAAAKATLVQGIQVLIDQGLYQFRKWTGLNPPREIISRAVYGELEAEGK
eukprot:TRINITY_DN12889_c1_g3_i1.p1 TRINITY_DN12889_c1_g3~~TRINITY_DN12889_c1_g3_i1.p1  ORF type:complete len:1520 (+),score=376.75 TRINITY_DN12889_c1_g3_i1:67-4560(+)